MGSKRSPPPLGALSEFPPLVESSKPSAQLFDEEGIIEHLRDLYGFIRLKRFPGETASFHRDDEARYLGRRVASANDVFKVGDVVRFDAVPNQRFHVSSRWRVSAFHFVHGLPGWAPSKPCRDWNLNDDKSRELTDCDGVVDRLKSQYGFIRLGPHVSPAAFFRVSVLERSMKTTINDIGEVLAVGDLVRFDAELNLKDDTSAKWWVTHIQPISRIRPSADRCLGESSEKPRSSEGVDDSSKDTDEDRPSAVTKGTEKRFPWSYARCAARAVAVEGVVTNSSPARKAPGTPAAAVVDRLASSVARPSLLIYRGVSGVVRSVQGGASVYCEVKEAAGTRRISLAEGCAFYKDGVRCPEDGGTIAKAVSEGDELTVDYAVSAEDLSKEADVYCHLVWQGERPKDVPNLTLELLGRALKTGPEKNPDPGAKDMLKIRESPKKAAGGSGPAQHSAKNCDDDADCVDGAGAADAPSDLQAMTSIMLSEGNAAKIAEVIVQELSALLQNNHVQKHQQKRLQQKQQQQQPEEQHQQHPEQQKQQQPQEQHQQQKEQQKQKQKPQEQYQQQKEQQKQKPQQPQEQHQQQREKQNQQQKHQEQNQQQREQQKQKQESQDQHQQHPEQQKQQQPQEQRQQRREKHNQKQQSQEQHQQQKEQQKKKQQPQKQHQQQEEQQKQQPQRQHQQQREQQNQQQQPPQKLQQQGDGCSRPGSPAPQIPSEYVISSTSGGLDQEVTHL